MYFPALALGFAFVAIGLPFVAKARQEADPVQQRNKRFAGIAFLFAGAAFFISFAISAVNR
jgi:hypothetical protein